MLKVDARGMSCPQPVLMVKKAVNDKKADIEVIVDNNTAKQNVTRFLKSSGYTKLDYLESGEDIIIKGAFK